MELYFIASNTVSVAVPKNYGHSTNNADSVEGYNEGNASSLNNSEEPVPLELQPTPIPTQLQVSDNYDILLRPYYHIYESVFLL